MIRVWISDTESGL